MDKRTANKIRSFTTSQCRRDNLQRASQSDLQNKRKFITERAISPVIKMEKTIEDLKQEIKQAIEYGRL